MKKKRIKYYLVLTILTFFAFTLNVSAAGTVNVSMWTNVDPVVVGNQVTFTVDLTTANGGKFSSWSYRMSCSSNLIFQSGDKEYTPGEISNSHLTNKRFTFKYKATSSGTGTCTFTILDLPDSAVNTHDAPQLGGTRTKKDTVKIITQAQLEASYSKNNNLSSLSIDGYQLSPSFNKNTLEYSVELPNDVTKIKVNASKEDKTASISGAGERNVSEGANKLEVKVTAQNGSVKTYVINATVKELDPIIVTVNNEQYNVVRKQKEITAPNSNFTEKEIKINNLEVPAFENEKLGYTLVGLKDREGTIELYIYNKKENTYKKYKEYNFKSSIIGVLDDESKIPEGYKKYTTKINDEEITAYKISAESKFYVFYGINVESGEKNLYVYDSIEKTIQRYNDGEVIEIYEEELKEKETLYQYLIIGLGCLLIVTYLIVLIYLITNSKKKKRNKMKKMFKKRNNTILDNEIDEKETEEEE